MGSICKINMNPVDWPALPMGQKSKPDFGGEWMIRATYGELDDDPGGTVPMETIMRQSVYDRCISGSLIVAKESKEKRRLILKDRETGKYLEPLMKGSDIY